MPEAKKQKMNIRHFKEQTKGLDNVKVVPIKHGFHKVVFDKKVVAYVKNVKTGGFSWYQQNKQKKLRVSDRIKTNEDMDKKVKHLKSLKA
jgi:hypothetical protein